MGNTSSQGMLEMKRTDKRKIDEHLMNKIENLSMLKLSEAERAKAMERMEEILSYVEVLEQLNTEEVDTNVRRGDLYNCFREDEVTNGDGTQDLLMNAPARYNNQIVVPKTIG